MSRSAKSGRDERVLNGQQHGDGAAITPESSTANPITAFARTPSRRAVRKSVAAARICRPIVVRPSSSASATRATTQTTIAISVIRRMSRPQSENAWLIDAAVTGERHARDRRRCLADRPVADVDQERHVLEQERDGERRHQHHRLRLDAQRPEDETLDRERQREHDGEAEGDLGPDGPVALGGEGERVRPCHDELAVGEVDESQDAEDETDPDRHQRVDGAETDRVDDRLGVHHGQDGRPGHER